MIAAAAADAPQSGAVSAAGPSAPASRSTKARPLRPDRRDRAPLRSAAGPHTGPSSTDDSADCSAIASAPTGSPNCTPARNCSSTAARRIACEQGHGLGQKLDVHQAARGRPWPPTDPERDGRPEARAHRSHIGQDAWRAWPLRRSRPRAGTPRSRPAGRHRPSAGGRGSAPGAPRSRPRSCW